MKIGIILTVFLFIFVTVTVTKLWPEIGLKKPYRFVKKGLNYG
jgi:hypothetical protein